MVIGSYTSIITLNVNGLNANPKGVDWLSGWKHVLVCISTYHITLLDSSPQVVCSLFYIVKLIIFQLWLAVVIIFYFLSGYWLWKLINIFYFCDYSLNTTVSWLANRKIIELYTTNAVLSHLVMSDCQN